MQHKSRTFALSVMFEAGLGFVGLTIAWLAGITLHERLQVSSPAITRGLLATLPMLALFAVGMLSVWGPFRELRTQIEQLVRELFLDFSWLELALVSFAAGVGEEFLFRGALQPWITSWTNPWIAFAVVSLMFGLAHAMSATYFVVATVIGGYLGWLAIAFDDLVAPIVAHAVYDFVALVFVRQRVKAKGV